MLQRAWHDVRGAARAARKEASEANLHKLRIRVKDLRYGCETVALVEGGPARKTAKAAERLQTKLGDLHDVCFSIAWLADLAEERRDLSDPVERLVAVQRDAVARDPQGLEGRAQRGRASMAALAGLRRYPGGLLTPMWSDSQSLMPPRMPAVLSTMVTSSSRPSRFTRREFPPPM